MKAKTCTKWTRLGLTKLILATAVVAIGGCGGGGGDTSGGGSTGVPQIVVATTLLDFGAVVANNFNFSDRSITVQNTGTAPLAIGQIGVLFSPFSIAEDKCSGSAVPPSGNCSIKVRFTPTALGDSNATFNITSNDSDQNPLAISLKGLGTFYGVAITSVDTSACSDGKLKLQISVVNAAGAPVTDLMKDHFSVFENSTPIDAASLTWSHLSVGVPVSASLGLDYSASMIPVTLQLQQAAKSFVDQMNAGVDEAEVIKFDQNVILVQDFTMNQEFLRSAIDADFPGARQDTALYDAILRSIGDTSKRASVNNRVVIVVSDGKDNASVATLSDVVNSSIQKGIPVFTISVGTDGAEELQQLAQQTGGQYFLANTGDDLLAVYSKVSQVLSNQYLIDYPTVSSGGGTVSIRVEVNNNSMRGTASRVATGC